MRILILISLALLLSACSSSRRCARIVKRNPECFRGSIDTLRDTSTILLASRDTLIQVQRDTERFQTPCGEVQVIREPAGALRIKQEAPRIQLIQEKIQEKIQLPAPCDCEKLTSELKKAKRGRFSFGLLSFLFGLAFGVGLSAFLVRARS